MVKKKATGMSKRLGFTDRATINENKDILRFNDRLEREAQGLPADGPPRGGRRRPDGERARGQRPAQQARPPRPPALDEEQTATLRAAYRAVVGESGLEPAAERVIEQLTAHVGFERATMSGWETASGGHAGDRTAEQWELLRAAWLAIRVALLEAYATLKPEAQELLDRERKQQARLAKPQRPRRRPGRAPGERRPPKQPSAGPRAPSPSAVARRAAAEHPAAGEEAAAASEPVDVTGAESEAQSEAQSDVQPDTQPEAQPEPQPEPQPESQPESQPDAQREATIDPVTELVDERPTEPVTPPVDESQPEPEPQQPEEPQPEAESHPEAEHPGYVVPAAEAAPPDEADDQLTLEF